MMASQQMLAVLNQQGLSVSGVKGMNNSMMLGSGGSGKSGSVTIQVGGSRQNRTVARSGSHQPHTQTLLSCASCCASCHVRQKDSNAVQSTCAGWLAGRVAVPRGEHLGAGPIV